MLSPHMHVNHPHRALLFRTANDKEMNMLGPLLEIHGRLGRDQPLLATAAITSPIASASSLLASRTITT
jgi:hypothetical protein